MNWPRIISLLPHWRPTGAWVVLLILGGGAAGLEASSAPTDRASSRERPHWAFVAPARPAVPVVLNARWVCNPLDAFVMARLERAGVTPSPEADRRTLIRRLSLDLLGLLPSPAAVDRFVQDPQPDAYETLVDALLASPHFGERWGRHWLDLARYADSSGYQVDQPRPFAYLFRDWVIDAVNRDVPFDQFTVDQLAGDLLPAPTPAARIASGFHRMTLSNHEEGVDAHEFDCKARVDRVSTTGTAWLGLTLGCAECHNHKYDPFTQREFYQLYAFFNNSDEIEAPLRPAADPARIEQERKTWQEEYRRLKTEVRAARLTGETRLPELEGRLAALRRAEPRGLELKAMSFAERTNAPHAFVHIRGDFLRHGEEVEPGTPSVLPPLKCSGPRASRLDLARWIADPANPLTARVAVNHAWLHLFGRGLVNTPEDFGTRGEPPSHPELLDWLATCFVCPPGTVSSPGHLGESYGLGWSRKALIRLIVTSATYRQSSRARPELAERDPQNILLARQSRFRVESEIVRDLCLDAGGLLNDDLGGPSFHPYLAEDVKKLGAAGAFTWTDTEGPEKYRRGVYIYAQRTVPYPTSMTFDQADPTQCCVQREHSDTPLQALTLMNHTVFVECAEGLARRLMEGPPETPSHRVERAFALCLARRPTAAESARLLRLQQDVADAVRHRAGTGAPQAADVARAASLASPEKAGWLAVSQVVLNLDEFMTRE